MTDHAAFELIRPADSKHATAGRAISLEGNDYLETKFSNTKLPEPDFIKLTNPFEDQEAVSKPAQDQSSDASSSTSTPIGPEIYNDPDGEYVEKTWPDGRGERQFNDGKLITWEKDKYGGCITTTTQDGKVISSEHAYRDKDGSVIVDYLASSAEENYRARHAKDGSLTVDYADGVHLERHTVNDVTYSEMTGPRAHQNFKALESPDGTEVTYADGSAWTLRDGDFGFSESGILKSNFHYLATFWQLNRAYWMSNSRSVADVRRNQQ
jgi:hypothetical protein